MNPDSMNPEEKRAARIAVVKEVDKSIAAQMQEQKTIQEIARKARESVGAQVGNVSDAAKKPLAVEKA